jgi:diketogulonate reductase-like aldo/keto reductase
MRDYYKKESDGLLHLYHFEEKREKTETEEAREEKETHVHASAQVAIAYAVLDGGKRVHLFTHGTPEGMKAWMAAHNKACPEEHRATLKLLSDPLVINKAISEQRDENGHFAYFASLL